MIQVTPVILCGGSGTRLWPLSRTGLPPLVWLKRLSCPGDSWNARWLSMEKIRTEIEEVKIDK
jgi:hypothetical protein